MSWSLLDKKNPPPKNLAYIQYSCHLGGNWNVTFEVHTNEVKKKKKFFTHSYVTQLHKWDAITLMVAWICPYMNLCECMHFCISCSTVMCTLYCIRHFMWLCMRDEIHFTVDDWRALLPYYCHTSWPRPFPSSIPVERYHNHTHTALTQMIHPQPVLIQALCFLEVNITDLLPSLQVKWTRLSRHATSLPLFSSIICRCLISCISWLFSEFLF